MFRKTLACAVLALMVSAPVAAQQDAFRDGHPQEYTVAIGDTLWGISARFLRDPWYWPEIWYENPSIDNPHLIYPGDVVRLTTVDGQPRLTVERGGGVVKLSPEIRVEALDEAISTIPVSAIRPFLSGTRVVSADEFAGAPYIVAGADERVLYAAGDPIYVRQLPETPYRSWDVLRKGQPFIDPETGELLGYEATQVGTARMVNEGDPATFRLVSASREVTPEDRLFAVEDTALRSRFVPHAPAQPVIGVIMAVMDGVSQIGQYDVVALNRGGRDGLEVGHVLEIFREGRLVEDPVTQEAVLLPPEKAGELIVFRVFDRMSFGLVMEASEAMEVNDIVSSP